MAKKKGICRNDMCELNGQIQEVDEFNFVCSNPECHKELFPIGDNSKGQGTKLPLIIGAAVLGLVAIGGGGYYFLQDTGDDVKEIVLNHKSQTFFVSETDTLKVTALPKGVKPTYIWSTSDETVATVDNGIVKLVGEGKAIVSVKVKGDENISASCKYSVEAGEDSPGFVDAEQIGFFETEKDMILSVGNQKQLSIDCTPGSANEPVKWSSSNENIATVAIDGLVQAVAPGTAIIKAETGRTHTVAQIQVTVKKSSSSSQSVVNQGGRKIDLGFASYEGDVKNGKPEGNGTMTFKSAHVIPGSKGNIEAKAGESVMGKWVNGEVNLVTLYQKDGNKVLIMHK